MKRFLTRILIILALVVLSFGMLPAGSVQAATYTTWMAQLPSGNPVYTQSVRVWVNSDTALGETILVEYHNITAGSWTKIAGTYDNTSYPGANWRIDIPALAAGTQVEYQVITRNESNVEYRWSGFNWNYTVQGLPAVVYVDDSWAGTAAGADPDVAGPATNFGGDAFASIQTGVNGVAAGGTVNVLGGSYTEDVSVAKALTLQGVNDPGGADPAVLNGGLTVSAGSTIRKLKVVGDGSTTGVALTSGTTQLTNNFLYNHYNGVLINSPAANAVIGDDTWAEGNIITDCIHAVNLSNGTAVVKGNALSGDFRVFNQTGGTLSAYANNISGFSRARSGTGGTTLLLHNWWGSNDPLQIMPTGLTAADWQARLGAKINDWAEESDGSLSLLGAGLSGAGSLQIVWHGGGGSVAERPFGSGIEPYASRMCSDFFDLFAVGGSGSYTVSIPVDNTADCNTYTRDRKALYWIPANTVYASECSGADNKACWDGVQKTHTVGLSGQNLTVASLSAADLGGTAFAAGDIFGLDPTAVQVSRFTARNAASLPLGAAGLAVLLLAAWLGLRRRG